MEIDLGNRPHSGLGRRECEDCGILFTPRGPSHNRCDDCIKTQYRGSDFDEDGEMT